MEHLANRQYKVGKGHCSILFLERMDVDVCDWDDIVYVDRSACCRVVGQEARVAVLSGVEVNRISATGKVIGGISKIVKWIW